MAPLAHPIGKVPPVFDKLMHNYEKELLADHIRAEIKADGQKEGINTAFAAMLNVLVWNFDKLKNPATRLKEFHQVFTETINGVEELDEKQEFSEWLFFEQTSYKMIREGMEGQFMSDYGTTLAAIINKAAADKKITRKEISHATGIKLNTLNKSVFYAGTCSKEIFDKVADYIGLEMTPTEQAVYNERFINGRTKAEKFAEMKKEIGIDPEEVLEPVPIKEEVVEMVVPSDNVVKTSAMKTMEEPVEVVEEPVRNNSLKDKLIALEDRQEANRNRIVALEEELEKLKGENLKLSAAWDKVNEAVKFLEELGL